MLSNRRVHTLASIESAHTDTKGTTTTHVLSTLASPPLLQYLSCDTLSSLSRLSTPLPPLSPFRGRYYLSLRLPPSASSHYSLPLYLGRCNGCRGARPPPNPGGPPPPLGGRPGGPRAGTPPIGCRPGGPRCGIGCSPPAPGGGGGGIRVDGGGKAPGCCGGYCAPGCCAAADNCAAAIPGGAHIGFCPTDGIRCSCAAPGACIGGPCCLKRSNCALNSSVDREGWPAAGANAIPGCVGIG